VEVGAFVEGMQDDPRKLPQFERLVGARMGIASYYYGFGDVFPGPAERTFADGGARKVLVSWDMGATRFAEWSSGQHDDYLDSIAAAARSYPHVLYVRPWPEMNGDWQAFQPTAAGDRPAGGTYAEFRAAWRHVVTYLREHGATNLRWVFNPTADTYAETTPVRRIWPGSRYVDVLGLDGFNWGDSTGGLRWRSFADIFRAQYRTLTDLDRNAPVWICETASKEPAVDDGAPVDRGHRKAAWVRDMFDLTGMDRLRAVIWFQSHKERDWRVDSSAGSLRAVRAALRLRAGA
jgi:beta-mannanase